MDACRRSIDLPVTVHECDCKVCELTRRIIKADRSTSRLRELVWYAAHSLKDNWAIDWQPLIDIMEEVDEERRTSRDDWSVGFNPREVE